MAQAGSRPRALITGVGGFTGRYLAPILEAKGFEVFGTSFHGEPTSENLRTVDLTDKNQVEDFVQFVKPDVVAHLAAISFVGHEDVAEIYNMNIVGTRNLLAALSRLEVKPTSVLLASSANIYGNSTADPITEATPSAPQNDYAVSKLAMEYAAALWATELPITIVRPFNYTGVGQSLNFLVPKIVEHFRLGKTSIQLGNLDVMRDFSDVRTVAWVYSELLERPAPGEIFNIASGTATSLSVLLEKVEALSGHHLDVVSNPDLARSGEVSKLRGDASKLWAHIGNPPKFTLDDTIEWMLASNE